MCSELLKEGMSKPTGDPTLPWAVREARSIKYETDRLVQMGALDYEGIDEGDANQDGDYDCDAGSETVTFQEDGNTQEDNARNPVHQAFKERPTLNRGTGNPDPAAGNQSPAPPTPRVQVTIEHGLERASRNLSGILERTSRSKNAS